MDRSWPLADNVCEPGTQGKNFKYFVIFSSMKIVNVYYIYCLLQASSLWWQHNYINIQRIDVNMQDNYVHMRLIYVNVQHNYVVMT